MQPLSSLLLKIGCLLELVIAALNPWPDSHGQLCHELPHYSL